MDRNLGPDYRAESSKPPHHLAQDYDLRWGSQEYGRDRSRGHARYDEEESNPHGDKSVTESSFEYRDGAAVESPRHRQDMPIVVTGSDSSPVRRLKRKNEDVRSGVEITQTPTYDLDRHNTCDDMITEMNSDDPFKGQYTPSGNIHKERSTFPKPQRTSKKVKSGDEDAIPLGSVPSKKKSKKEKRQKGKESAESTGTFTIEAHTNAGYDVTPTPLQPESQKQSEPDRASVKSTGILGESKTSAKRTTKKVLSMSHQDHYQTTKNQIDGKSLMKFIRNHDIKQRECERYVPCRETGSYCVCGRDRDCHKSHGICTTKPPECDARNVWNYKTHTNTKQTDSFGIIQFHGFGLEPSLAPYIRLCPTTNLELVWTLLTDHWKLPIPKLLISVTGGAKGFELNPRLKDFFKRGLTNAATSTGAWIITGGTATGVMQIVGEAVHDHLNRLESNDNPVVALGITPWGCVSNRTALNREGDEDIDQDQKFYYAQYCLEDLSEPIKDNEAPLDHNHTHFIMVDDGKEGVWGEEIEFRAQLEGYLSEKVQTGVAESQSVNVPVVLLVVEGGVNTMKTVWRSIQQGIPVLVFNDSGRAANFIAHGYMHSKEVSKDKWELPASYDGELTTFAKEQFTWKPTDDVEKKAPECVKQLKDILKKRILVNIYNLSEDNTKDIDRAILYALLKANKTNASTQLSLAMAWNRCDIARHKIFTLDNRKYWKKIPLYDVMFTALVKNKTDFVQLFMENGVSLKKFLSIETLWNLYANVLANTADSTAQMLSDRLMYLKQRWKLYQCCQKTVKYRSEPDLLLSVGKLIVDLLENEALNPYISNRGCSTLLCCTARKKAGPTYRVNRSSHDLKWLPGNHAAKHTEYDFEFPERELFFWAILFNRKDLAKMFWKCGEDQIGSALVACSLLKSMSRRANDHEELELSNDLSVHGNLYEDMATGVLSECYKLEKKMARQLLVRRLKTFGKTTLFTLAGTNKFKLMTFMGHTCCQTKLNLIWKGRMAVYTPTWKILLSLFVLFFIPLIKFTISEDNDESNEREEPEKNPEDGHVLQDNNKTPRRDKIVSDIRTNSIHVWKALKFFYSAPVTVFVTNTIAYLVFLGLFTYFLLTDFYPMTPSVIEYVVWGWTFTMALEELRQISNQDQKSLWHKLRNWFVSEWNLFDLIMYVIFILSVVLRLVLKGKSFVYARIFFSITLSMFYLRFIGPKVIMIRNMLIDLLFFFFIFAVFLLSFGVAYQANLYPNSPPSWHLLKSVVYIPYWQMYGELFLENMEGELPDGCTNNETVWRASGGKDRCPEQNALVPLLASLYLMLTNVLLVNLLIAMFSYTFRTVNDSQEQVWRFYRYSLVYEYYDRPMFCPPFIIIVHAYRSILWLSRKICNGSIKKYHNEFKLDLNETENRCLTSFERQATENYINISQKAAKEELNSKVSNTVERRSMLDSSTEPFEARLSDLGDQVAKNSIQMTQLMQMMRTTMTQQRTRPSQSD